MVKTKKLKRLAINHLGILLTRKLFSLLSRMLFSVIDNQDMGNLNLELIMNVINPFFFSATVIQNAREVFKMQSN